MRKKNKALGFKRNSQKKGLKNNTCKIRISSLKKPNRNDDDEASP